MRMPPNRRQMLGLALLATLPRPGLAQAPFPDRPIRLIVPWAPGSSSDVQMRSLAELAAPRLGQPVLVENRPGGGGTLHARPLAASRPDGLTLGQMHPSVIRRAVMQPQMPWDPVADFSHIIRLCGWTLGLVVRADSPWPDMAAFVAYARANPGRVNIANSGTATSNHIGMVEVAAAAGIEVTHVPFRSSAEGITALLGGQVDALAGDSTWAPLVVSGQLRGLSVWSATRIASLPGLPTLKDLGYDMVFSTAYGISAPRGLPPEIGARLHDAFKAALAEPANAAVRARYDMPEEYLDGAAYTALIAERVARERALVQRLGLRLDE